METWIMASEPERELPSGAVVDLPDRETPVRGWTTANDNKLRDHNDEQTLAWWRRYLSAIPQDAKAVIEPEPVATNQGGHARRDKWRLRFPMRTKPHVDCLTGWTGGSDPMANVTLTFPDRGSAERFCARQGIEYSVAPPPNERHVPVNKQTFELDNNGPVTFD